MRKFIYLIICATLVISIPGRLLASNKTVKVGIYQNRPKVFVNSSGKPQGFFIDILNYIASKEGWQLDYIASTWEKNLEKLAKAEIDLLLDVAESEERAELFDFNKEIIFSNWATVYVNKKSQLQSILDLKGKNIATMKGDISYEDFRRKIENLGIYSTFEIVDNFSDVFEMIAQKKVDAGIISRLYGLQHEDEYEVTRSTIICCPENLYFAVPKKKNQDLIQKIDQHLFGYEVTAATNAEKAIEIYLAEKEKVDLVILDLNMPGMGGRKCLDRMLAIKPDLKTIVTSGYSSAAIVEDIHKSGTSIFVEKPYQLKDLLKIIRQVLDNHP